MPVLRTQAEDEILDLALARLYRVNIMDFLQIWESFIHPILCEVLLDHGRPGMDDQEPCGGKSFQKRVRSYVINPARLRGSRR